MQRSHNQSEPLLWSSHSILGNSFLSSLTFSFRSWKHYYVFKSINVMRRIAHIPFSACSSTAAQFFFSCHPLLQSMKLETSKRANPWRRHGKIHSRCDSYVAVTHKLLPWLMPSLSEGGMKSSCNLTSLRRSALTWLRKNLYTPDIWLFSIVPSCNSIVSRWNQFSERDIRGRIGGLNRTPQCKQNIYRNFADVSYLLLVISKCIRMRADTFHSEKKKPWSSKQEKFEGGDHRLRQSSR